MPQTTQAPNAIANTIDWGILLTDRQQRDRETIIPHVMAVTNPDCIANPQTLYLTDADLARRIVTENTQRLEKACRVLASRGARGHWTYDPATHQAALAVLRRERNIARALGAAAELERPACSVAFPTDEAAHADVLPPTQA